MANAIKKNYSNGEVIVHWEPEKCIHSQKCFKGLPSVFDPKQRPWVNVEGATSEQIITQVKKCPSMALSYSMEDGRDSSQGGTASNSPIEVEVSDKGPLMVKGHVRITHKDGSREEREKVTAFCRCGNSSNKPFCDGSHKKSDFDN